MSKVRHHHLALGISRCSRACYTPEPMTAGSTSVKTAGKAWRTVERLPDVPDSFFVNDIKADLHDADTVYVVVDDHKSGDYSPYVLKSIEPRPHLDPHRLRPCPNATWSGESCRTTSNPATCCSPATEFGVFFTIDGGGKWVKLGGGAPTISIRDLAIQKRENDLVAASFGRGFWILDDYTPLRAIKPEHQLNSEGRAVPGPRLRPGTLTESPAGRLPRQWKGQPGRQLLSSPPTPRLARCSPTT